MNMPVNKEGKVYFTTTLFALIRENLNIGMPKQNDEIDYPVEPVDQDQLDRQLKETIYKLWPLQAKKIADKLMPLDEELGKGKLTVGKIYAGLLVLENWRTTKFGRIQTAGLVVGATPPERFFALLISALTLRSNHTLSN